MSLSFRTFSILLVFQHLSTISLLKKKSTSKICKNWTFSWGAGHLRSPSDHRAPVLVLLEYHDHPNPQRDEMSIYVPKSTRLQYVLIWKINLHFPYRFFLCQSCAASIGCCFCKDHQELWGKVFSCHVLATSNRTKKSDSTFSARNLEHEDSGYCYSRTEFEASELFSFL